MVSLLLKGIIIGLSIAAPVGPIGVLCINRSLHEGWKSGLISGAGAATADGLYGCVAGFGLTWISGFLVDQQFIIRLIGGIFLLYLGIKTLISKPAQQVNISKNKRNLFRAYATTLFLTLTNPMTIMSFVAIFAGLGLGSLSHSYQDAVSVVLGVTLGSFLWWLLLCTGIAVLLRKHINRLFLQWINLISGLIIGGFGVIALFSII